MNFHAEVTYPTTLHEVLAMLRDPEYQRERLRVAGVDADSIEIVDTDDGFASVVKVTQSADELRLPSMAKRFLPADGVRATITESWSNGGDTGEILLDLDGLPVEFTATSSLTESDSSVKRVVDGTIRVSVPLVGKKIETQAVKHINDIVRAEEQAARNYLA